MNRKRWITLAITGVLTVAIVIAGILVFREAQDRFYRAQYPLKYTEWVEQYAAEYELDPVLVYAVICTESGFQADAVSPAGAIGLMQLTPDTFEWAQWRERIDPPYEADCLTDPELNIRFGCATLHSLGQLFSTEETVLAAYNAGMGNVWKWLDDPAYSDDGETLHTIPFAETEQYVQKVAEAKEMYRSLYDL